MAADDDGESGVGIFNTHVDLDIDQINDTWSLKAEYRYYDLGEETYGVNAIGGEGTEVDLDLHTVQVGVNIHF